MNTRSFTAITLALSTLGLAACAQETTVEKVEVYYSEKEDTTLFIRYVGHNLTAQEDFRVYHDVKGQHRVALGEKGYKHVAEAIRSNRNCEMHVSYRGSDTQAQIKSFNCREENNGVSIEDALDKLS